MPMNTNQKDALKIGAIAILLAGTTCFGLIAPGSLRSLIKGDRNRQQLENVVQTDPQQQMKELEQLVEKYKTLANDNRGIPMQRVYEATANLYADSLRIVREKYGVK